MFSAQNYATYHLWYPPRLATSSSRWLSLFLGSINIFPFVVTFSPASETNSPLFSREKILELADDWCNMGQQREMLFLQRKPQDFLYMCWWTFLNKTHAAKMTFFLFFIFFAQNKKWFWEKKMFSGKSSSENFWPHFFDFPSLRKYFPRGSENFWPAL